jgi:hypothetical protein
VSITYLFLIPEQKKYYLTSPLSDSLTGLKKSYNFGDRFEILMQPKEIRILNFDPTPKDWSKFKAIQTRTKADYVAKAKRDK